MDRLTLKEVSERTGIHIAMLNRWIAVPGIKSLMGAEGLRPTYPEEALPLFLHLDALYRSGDVNKKNISTTGITLLREARQSEIQNPNSAQQTLVPNAQVQGSPGFDAHQFAALVAAAVQQAVAEALAADRQQNAQDEFLTRQEAAGALKCHVGSIRRLTGIVPIRRGVYLRSDIDQYMARLKAQRAEREARAAPALPAPPSPDTES